MTELNLFKDMTTMGEDTKRLYNEKNLIENENYYLKRDYLKVLNINEKILIKNENLNNEIKILKDKIKNLYDEIKTWIEINEDLEEENKDLKRVIEMREEYTAKRSFDLEASESEEYPQYRE